MAESSRANVLQVHEYDEDPTTEQNRNAATTFRRPPREYVLTASVAKQSGRAAETTVEETTKRQQSSRRWLRAPIVVLRELFLPVGFPSTVNEGYLQYQLYDSLQGLCSYLRGVVCSAQVLQAAGVGNAEATAMSAAMTWALKDGLGMLGGLFFSFSSSHLFDSHVKEFRLFADLINDVGLTLDMLAPYAGPKNLLLVTSMATLCKTLCGISAGATKGSITHHFAVQGNMADLNAKESTQETAVSLLGITVGVALAQRLSRLEQELEHPDLALQIQWGIFIVLTLVHVWANYRGVALLRMRTLNRERAEIVLAPLVDHFAAWFVTENPAGEKGLPSLLSGLPLPSSVRESLLSSTYKMLVPGAGRVRLNTPLSQVLACSLAATGEEKFCRTWSSERYILALDDQGRVLVSLLVGAKAPHDELKAFFHAILVAKYVKSRRESNFSFANDLELTHRQVSFLFPSKEDDSAMSLVGALEARGWDIQERLYLDFSRRRGQWNKLKKDD